MWTPSSVLTSGADMLRKLHEFAVAASQLGCSAGILSATYNLRCRLVHVLSLFRENAADIFPGKIHHRTLSKSLESLPSGESQQSKARLLAQRTVTEPETDRDKFPEHMVGLSEDLEKFRMSLYEYPEFWDEEFNKSILVLKAEVAVSVGYCLLS